LRYSRRKDAREVRYVVEMVGAIAVGDGRRINETKAGRVKGGCGIERNPWDMDEKERGRRRGGATRRGKDGRERAMEKL